MICMSNNTTEPVNVQYPQLSGIRRCVNGGDEIADTIQAATTLDELKATIRNNATLIGRVRSFCQRENIVSMTAVLRDIGKMWQSFSDLDDDMEYSYFQDFMRELTTATEQRNFMSEMLVEYHGYMRAEKKLTRGELIKPFYPDATIDIPAELTLPNVTYTIDERGGIWKMNSLVCRGALLIVKRIKLISDGRRVFEIAFQTDTGEWATTKINSDFLAEPKKFSPFIGYGIQVDMNTMKVAMQYLSSFAQSNRGDIPTVQGTTHLGWHQEKLMIDTQNPDLEIITESNLNPTLKAIVSKGTLDEWIANVFDVAMEGKTNGKFLLGLASALGSLFLEPLGAPNGWFLHYFGASRSGKSTTMKAIASAIGCPINEGVWKSWDNTKVYLERYCAFMGSIGVFLDEAKAEQKNVIQETVYMIANGMGKGRGTPGGVAQTLTWKLNVVSTGEFDLKETANQEGFENRIISLTPPMGKSFFNGGNRTATLLEENLGKYHGTLIQAYAPLVEDLGQEEIVLRYKQVKEALMVQMNPDDLESGRVHTFIGYFTIMFVALDLLMNQILHLDDDQAAVYIEVFMNEFKSFMSEIANGKEDRSERVLNVVTSLIFSNMGKFYSSDRGDNREPPTGFWGKVITNDRNLMTVGVKPEIIQDHLKRFGFTISEFERMAEENGCLTKDGKHFKGTFRLNGGKIKGYILRLNTFAD